MLPLLLAGLFAVAAEPTPGPASEAVVDRFIAVLPDTQRLARVDRSADAAELERLSQLNPGREADVRRLLEDQAGCAGAARNGEMNRTLRAVARQLGDEKVLRMIRFYEGGDMPIFGRLVEKGEGNL